MFWHRRRSAPPTGNRSHCPNRGREVQVPIRVHHRTCHRIATGYLEVVKRWLGVQLQALDHKIEVENSVGVLGIIVLCRHRIKCFLVCRYGANIMICAKPPIQKINLT